MAMESQVIHLFGLGAVVMFTFRAGARALARLKRAPLSAPVAVVLAFAVLLISTAAAGALEPGGRLPSAIAGIVTDGLPDSTISPVAGMEPALTQGPATAGANAHSFTLFAPGFPLLALGALLALSALLCHLIIQHPERQAQPESPSDGLST